MQCLLCELEIKNFHPLLNSLKINEDRTVNICKGCFDKIVKWQKEVFAELFPTRRAKKFKR